MLAPVVDLTTYPIDDLSTAAAQSLVSRCREDLRRRGAAVLPGFVSGEALAAMVAEARQLAPQAFITDSTHNIYLSRESGTPTDADVRTRRLATVVGSVAYDLLPDRSPLRSLYEWNPLIEFVRTVIEVPELHRLADPLGACSINVFRPGDSHAWHFDEAEYTTTLMLQEADDGGHFDYLGYVRQPDGGEARRLTSLLDGDEDGVQRLPFVAGSLSIFAGNVSVHRVTEVLGAATRLVAVLTFNRRPAVTNRDAVRTLFWGRTS
jgi:alkylated DNA repair dioxygenase AlkB